MKLLPFLLLQGLLLITFSCKDDEGSSTDCLYELYDASNYKVLRSDIGSISNIIQTEDGFLAFGTGKRADNLRTEFQLTKLNQDLSIDWVKYAEEEEKGVFSRAMIRTKDQGFLICGTTDPTGLRGIYLIKLDAEGHELWTETYTTTFPITADQLVQLEDESYVLGGFALTGPSITDEYILKIDKDGDELWSQVYPYTFRDKVVDMVVSSDGNIIFMSTRVSANGLDHNLILSKIDGAGTLFWEVNLGLTSQDGIGQVLANTSDNQLVIGASSATGGAVGNTDYLIYKVDEEGIIQWTNTFGNDKSEYTHDVVEQGDYFYFLGSGNTCSNDRSDIFINKVDKDGNLITQSAYGGDAYEAPSKILAVSDDELLVTGHIQGQDYTQDFDLILFKVDNDGVPR